MFNRILISIVFLASLAWIGYVGLDILSDQNIYDENRLFGIADEQLLIINRAEEVDLNLLNGFSICPTAEIVKNLNPEAFKRGYVSARQAQLLLERTTNWDTETINLLFSNSDTKPVIDEDGFTYGDYIGRFYKKKLYLSSGEITFPEQRSERAIYDKNASASIIQYDEASKVLSVSDIYFKVDGKIDYITKNTAIQQGNQIKDEVVFSNVVTKNFQEYHFYERDFYAAQDSVFAKSPMARWMLSGFIELNYSGSKVLISDYINGQDPILILNDLMQTYDKESFEIPLMEGFPANGKSYTLNYLEDLIVISESKEVCDRVLADFKLGQTIALDEGTRHKVYGQLPTSVSERHITKENAYTRAVYSGKLLETHINLQAAVTPTTVRKEAISANCGFDVADFAVLPSGVEIVALGKNGAITKFSNGKKDWSQKLDSAPINGVQIIDLHYNGQLHVLANSRNEIHLYNLKGEMVSGFPIKLENEASNQVKFYRWKGSSFFFIATGNEVRHYDAKGRELNIIQTAIPVTRQIDVWASQSTLFAGFANDNHFIMYNVEKRKNHREFDLPGACLSAKIPNELLQFGLKDNTVFKMTQKGIRIDYSSFDRPKILNVSVEDGTPYIAVQSANEVHVLNSEGIPFAEIPLSFNEIEYAFIRTSNSGKTSIAVIDGLENNVYLYGLDGNLIVPKALEGQTKVMISYSGSQRIITTIVDQFVVQYFE